MSNNPAEPVSSQKSTDSKTRAPYIFLSHDTRDADVAEAFSRLLSSVTAGVLKCFRSSDKKGSQGIEYGVEWFPELMKKLQEASDVVCLLTDNSTNRPWILFEAGVAKGKLDTPILGLAIGIPLNVANTGPFAQFQNSDDEEDSLVKLVIQLVRKIPGAEPDETIVRQQVLAFKGKATELLKKKPEKPKEQKKDLEDTPSVAKLFEEVKVMFNDLPARMEAQASPVRRRRPRRLSPGMIEELMMLGSRSNPTIGFLFTLSLIREDLPWIYDLGRDLVAALRRGEESEFKDALAGFHNMIEYTMHSPMGRELFGERSDFLPLEEVASRLHNLAEELPMLIRRSKKG